MPETTEQPREGRARGGSWVTIKFKVPPDWKRWLDEAAQARATTVSEICRQLIRQLMLGRPR